MTRKASIYNLPPGTQPNGQKFGNADLVYQMIEGNQIKILKSRWTDHVGGTIVSQETLGTIIRETNEKVANKETPPGKPGQAAVLDCDPNQASAMRVYTGADTEPPSLPELSEQKQEEVIDWPENDVIPEHKNSPTPVKDSRAVTAYKDSAGNLHETKEKSLESDLKIAFEREQTPINNLESLKDFLESNANLIQEWLNL